MYYESSLYGISRSRGASRVVSSEKNETRLAAESFYYGKREPGASVRVSHATGLKLQKSADTRHAR